MFSAINSGRCALPRRKVRDAGIGGGDGGDLFFSPAQVERVDCSSGSGMFQRRQTRAATRRRTEREVLKDEGELFDGSGAKASAAGCTAGVSDATELGEQPSSAQKVFLLLSHTSPHTHTPNRRHHTTNRMHLDGYSVCSICCVLIPNYRLERL